MKNLFLSILLLPAAVNAQLTTINTPSSETLNGIAVVPGLTIAVGNNGSIVHLNADNPNGEAVPSGTGHDLFDVYAHSNRLALVSGNNRLLLWDGMTYSTLFSLNDNPPSPLLPVWISPDRAAAQFAILGSGGAPSVLCTESLDGEPSPPFCRAGPLPLAFCGTSYNFIFIDQTGSIVNLQRDLDAAPGAPGDGTLFTAPTSHQFTAAWVMPGSCSPIQDLSTMRAFAIDNFTTLMSFDGMQWQTVGMVDPGQTLTWLGGTSANNVVSVGFAADPMSPGQNRGVVWTWDGVRWDEYGVPLGTPGLADVAIGVGFHEVIQSSGFEAPVRVKQFRNRCNDSEPETYFASSGDFGTVTSSCGASAGELVDPGIPAADVEVKLDSVGFSTGMGTAIVTVINYGPADLANLPVQFGTTVSGHTSNNCPHSTVAGNGASLGFNLKMMLDTLASGDSFSCQVQMTTTGSTAIGAAAIANIYVDTRPENNSDRILPGQH